MSMLFRGAERDIRLDFHWQLPRLRARTVTWQEIINDIGSGGIGKGVDDVLHNMAHFLENQAKAAPTVPKSEGFAANFANEATKLVISTGEHIGKPHEHP